MMFCVFTVLRFVAGLHWEMLIAGFVNDIITVFIFVDIVIIITDIINIEFFDVYIHLKVSSFSGFLPTNFKTPTSPQHKFNISPYVENMSKSFVSS